MLKLCSPREGVYLSLPTSRHGCQVCKGSVLVYGAKKKIPHTHTPDTPCEDGSWYCNDVTYSMMTSSFERAAMPELLSPLRNDRTIPTRVEPFSNRLNPGLAARHAFQVKAFCPSWNKRSWAWAASKLKLTRCVCLKFNDNTVSLLSNLEWAHT